MGAVLRELKVQVRVGKAARAPMLPGDNLTRRGHKFGAEFATPSAVLEARPRPGRPLNRRIVLPGSIVACPVAPMHGIGDPQLRLPRCVEDFKHMKDAAVRLGNGFDAGPDLGLRRSSS